VPPRRLPRRPPYSVGLLQSPLYSRNCLDALHVLERLAVAAHARPGSVRNVPALAAETGLAVPTITQVLGFLRQAGLVVPRGPSGGVRLTRPAREISLLEVARATDGAGMLGRCVMGLARCSDDAPCPVHPVWKRTREELERHLESQSIADFTHTLTRRRRTQGMSRRTRRRAR
jgi:Rrf2 family iron-sulfur cluster assembly transcriptional regulator